MWRLVVVEHDPDQPVGSVVELAEHADIDGVWLVALLRLLAEQELGQGRRILCGSPPRRVNASAPLAGSRSDQHVSGLDEVADDNQWNSRTGGLLILLAGFVFLHFAGTIRSILGGAEATVRGSRQLAALLARGTNS